MARFTPPPYSRFSSRPGHLTRGFAAFLVKNVDIPGWAKLLLGGGIGVAAAHTMKLPVDQALGAATAIGLAAQPVLKVGQERLSGLIKGVESSASKSDNPLLQAVAKTADRCAAKNLTPQEYADRLDDFKAASDAYIARGRSAAGEATGEGGRGSNDRAPQLQRSGAVRDPNGTTQDELARNQDRSGRPSDTRESERGHSLADTGSDLARTGEMGLRQERGQLLEQARLLHERGAPQAELAPVFERIVEVSEQLGRLEDGTTPIPETKTAETNSAQPEAAEPAPGEMEAAETEAAGAEAADPEAVEPEAVEPEAGEPEAGEPEAAEPEAAETEAAETKAVETKAVETKAVETKAVETKAVETKAVDPEAAEPEAAEPEAAEPEAAEPRAAPVGPIGGLAGSPRRGTEQEIQPQGEPVGPARKAAQLEAAAKAPRVVNENGDVARGPERVALQMAQVQAERNRQRAERGGHPPAPRPEANRDPGRSEVE
jgi:hypothetical protein